MVGGERRVDSTMRQATEVRAGRPRLLVIADGEATTYPLPTEGAVVIGRAPECDVTIDHASVSRRHAVLRTGAGCSLEDLGSANGTRVGGRLLAPGNAVEVEPGAVFDLGATALVIQSVVHSGATGDGAPRGPAGSDLRSGIDAMRELERLVERIAPGRLPILFVGETGSGKEVLARALHRRSPRAARPFVAFHCAAVPETLLESEMFGHERGAFTGAVQAKPGLFELASGGTVFLDEIGELPPWVQTKLLRVLEERTILRVGAVTARPLDVRFVAATHRDLEAEVAAGRFRQDLLFRLNGATLRVPPLRERRHDIEGLARRFVTEASAELGLEPEPELSAEALALLLGHPWPGNVRELRHVIERAVLLAERGAIGARQLALAPAAAGPAGARAPDPSGATATPGDAGDARRRIVEALQACGGNQSRAAGLLGISRRTLTKRLGELGLPRPIKDRR